MNLKSIFLLLFSAKFCPKHGIFNAKLRHFRCSTTSAFPTNSHFWRAECAIAPVLDIDGDNDADLFVQDRANHLIFSHGGIAKRTEFQWKPMNLEICSSVRGSNLPTSISMAISICLPKILSVSFAISKYRHRKPPQFRDFRGHAAR